ncbi:hypothetical protein D3C85_913710 [compost metagenome]
MHIDYVGRIPYLLTSGFKRPILYGEPFAKLLPIVLEDAFKLGFSPDQKQVERYIKLIEQRIIALPYKTRFTLRDTQSPSGITKHYSAPSKAAIRWASSHC